MNILTRPFLSFFCGTLYNLGHAVALTRSATVCLRPLFSLFYSGNGGTEQGRNIQHDVWNEKGTYRRADAVRHHWCCSRSFIQSTYTTSIAKTVHNYLQSWQAKQDTATLNHGASLKKATHVCTVHATTCCEVNVWGWSGLY